MTDHKQVMQAALEALESLFSGQADTDRPKRCSDAIAALRAALAEPPAVESKAEMSWRDAHALVTAPTEPPAVPVAWVMQSVGDGSISREIAPTAWNTFDKELDKLNAHPWIKAGAAKLVPLYTRPPRTEPTGLANLNVAKLIDIADKKGMDLS